MCDIAHWLDEGEPLPPRPILVTFDDGYRDNREVAWPIMRDRGILPIIFLATDHIGTGHPFLWDLAAYYFARTQRERLNLPLVGPVNLETIGDRDAHTVAWVEAVKRIPGSERKEALANLSQALDVPSPPEETFQHLYLDWSDVRELAAQGVGFGGHTRTHPILTRVSRDEAEREILDSIGDISAMLGSKPLSFAYPNGSSSDFSQDHEQMVRQCGVPFGFSLEPGPTSLSAVRRRPAAIRRIFVSRQDHLPRFVSKLAGGARIANSLRSLQRRLQPF
jgi:peptidoglycan/xylan/chitin deacetylase (PgdA/CDA1 family)